MTNKQGAEMAKRAAVVAGTSLLSMAMWGCNVQEPPVFDPKAILRGNLNNAFGQRTRPLGVLPTTRESYDPSRHQAASRPVTGEEPQFVRMSLREIMHRAAANNQEVRVAGYDPAIAETRVMESEGHYDPIFFSNLRYDKQADRTPGTVIPNPSNPQQTITINTEDNDIYTVEAGIKRYLESGGQIQLSYQVQHSDYFPVRYTRNNYWDDQLKFQITQPLLREFGYEINWARITVARNDQRVSILDYRKTLEDNTDELEKTTGCFTRPTARCRSTRPPFRTPAIWSRSSGTRWLTAVKPPPSSWPRALPPSASARSSSNVPGPTCWTSPTISNAG